MFRRLTLLSVWLLAGCASQNDYAAIEPRISYLVNLECELAARTRAQGALSFIQKPVTDAVFAKRSCRLNSYCRLLRRRPDEA